MVKICGRYIFTFIKNNEIENVKGLNEFHRDIKSTHDIEKNGTVCSAYVNVARKVSGHLTTDIYGRKTDTNQTENHSPLYNGR